MAAAASYFSLIHHQLNLAIDLQTADTEDTVIRWCNYPPIAHPPRHKTSAKVNFLISDQLTLPTRPTPAPASAELSLFVLVEALFRHLKLFLLVAGVTFALALAWIFATPRQYESHSAILVQNAG